MEFPSPQYYPTSPNMRRRGCGYDWQLINNYVKLSELRCVFCHRPLSSCLGNTGTFSPLQTNERLQFPIEIYKKKFKAFFCFEWSTFLPSSAQAPTPTQLGAEFALIPV